MATILDSFKGINAYPIPQRTITDIVEGRGLSATDEATNEVRKSAKYNLAKSDLYKWLASAPNIAQGGQSYSFSEPERIYLRNEASSLYKEHCAVGNPQGKSKFGHKGSKL